MDHAILFLFGVFLVPLALVSLVGAWAESRKPVVGLVLLVCAAGIFAGIAFHLPDGLYSFAEIPVLVVEFAARVMRLF